MPKHIYEFLYEPLRNDENQVEYVELEDNSRVIGAELNAVGTWRLLIEEKID